MILIVVNGGGTLIIGKQLDVWSRMYPNVNVEYEIKKLDSMGIFKRKTVNGAAKYINQHLERKNKKMRDNHV